MKQIVRHRLILGLLLFTALFSVVPSYVFAVAGTIYFDRSSGNILSGSEFTLEVRGNVPGPNTWPFYGGGTTTIVSYDASKLQMVSYNDTNGVFRNGTKNWNGTSAGTVRYQSSIAVNAPGVNNQKIISVTFKALSPGRTTLRFASGTSVNDGPTTGTPATFTIITPTCPSGQVGSPPNCTTPAPAPSPTPSPSPSPTPRPMTSPTPSSSPTPSTSAPQSQTILPAPTLEEVPTPTNESDGGLRIENVKVTSNRQKSSVSWQLTSDSVTPTLSYGTSKTNMTAEATVTKLESGAFEATFPPLSLGALYYFSIKAATTDQLQGATYSGTFTTKGYPVRFTVQQNGILFPGAKVKIGERSFIANKEAVITTELGDGKYDAVITTSNPAGSSTVQFSVAKKAIPTSGDPDVQHFVLNATAASSSLQQDQSPFALIIGSIVTLLVVTTAIIGFFVVRRRQQSQDQSGVDSDLLAASYGPSLADYRSNTPEPNLETQGSAPFAIQEQLVVPAKPPQDATGSTSDMPAYNQEETTIVTPQQPIPLQPSDVVPEVMAEGPEMAPSVATATDTVDTEPARQADELSQPVVAVESVEAETTEANDQEETAVYDATTGELDIIHHRSLEQPR